MTTEVHTSLKNIKQKPNAYHCLLDKAILFKTTQEIQISQKLLASDTSHPISVETKLNFMSDDERKNIPFYLTDWLFLFLFEVNSKIFVTTTNTTNVKFFKKYCITKERFDLDQI